MASPVADIGQSHQHPPVSEAAADSAFQEAQTWIEVSDKTESKYCVNSSGLWFIFRTGVLLSLCGLSYWLAACICSTFSFKPQFDLIASSPVERLLKLQLFDSDSDEIFPTTFFKFFWGVYFVAVVIVCQYVDFIGIFWSSAILNSYNYLSLKPNTEWTSTL